VLGSLGIGRDDARGRKGYRAWTDGRALECSNQTPDELEKECRRIRRGWYLGHDAFKTRMLDWIEQRAGKAFDSSDRAAKRAHDERTAEKRVAAGLKAVGLEKKDLDRIPKGAPEKLVLAWWLKRSTTVSRQWISERLAMGHPTRVTSAGRDVQGAKDGSLAKMRRQLEELKL
ncbi:MAG: hypothetical protein O2960_11430, partial [Verrucomicrobia bacterium]|nr:hypothetical protein [Verrucomicrobiota bacterium]